MNDNQPPADEKLMPCRWCGSDRSHIEREETSWTGEKVVGVDDDNGPIYYVECDGCMARGPLASWAIDAREKWNATPPAAPAGSVTELCANHSNLREYIGQLERERDEAKARAIQAWKDADAAILREVESRVASIMGSPDNEIARLTVSKNVFRDERDALQAERNTLRSQLAHARSRGDDKEIAEKERDAARAELAALRKAMIYAVNHAGGSVSDECSTEFLCIGADQIRLHVRNLVSELAAVRAAYAWLHSQVGGYLHGKDWEHWKQWNEPKALQSVVGGGWIKCSDQLPMAKPYSSRVLIHATRGNEPGATYKICVGWLYPPNEWREDKQIGMDPMSKDGWNVTHWRPLPTVPGEGGK
jgi:hypothetical protein